MIVSWLGSPLAVHTTRFPSVRLASVLLFLVTQRRAPCLAPRSLVRSFGVASRPSKTKVPPCPHLGLEGSGGGECCSPLTCEPAGTFNPQPAHASAYPSEFRRRNAEMQSPVPKPPHLSDWPVRVNARAFSARIASYFEPLFDQKGLFGPIHSDPVASGRASPGP
jgi:hypothetical protein